MRLGGLRLYLPVVRPGDAVDQCQAQAVPGAMAVSAPPERLEDARQLTGGHTGTVVFNRHADAVRRAAQMHANAASVSLCVAALRRGYRSCARRLACSSV